MRGTEGPSRARIVAAGVRDWQWTSESDISRNMQVKLTDSWSVGPVQVPSRLVLAPMAGVSVQAFRRQGRRFGAGLVCSEMVSLRRLSFGNERTLGYLRIGADEHPLAVQIFGSEPALMAEAARMVEAAGADLVDVNFGCPVRKVTKTGAGATLLEDPGRACRIVESVALAVAIPVTVKMRRGLEDGSRTMLSRSAPRLVEAGAASLTLHPRSARQMYAGSADHVLTAELVSLVDVPVVASGDVTSHARAEAVLAQTNAEAVMIGRAAQGNPWTLGILDGIGDAPPGGGRRGALPVRARDRARARRAPRGRVPEEVLRLVSARALPQAARPGARSPPDHLGGGRSPARGGAGAAFVLQRLEGELPRGDEVTLPLVISAYGGG